LLYKLMGDGDTSYEKLGLLLTGEIIEPSEHFGAIADRFIRPQHEVLLGIVQELLPGVEERTVNLCASGVLGHCLLFDNFKQLIRRLCPEMALENLGVELVAHFVFEYALAGIERMKTLQE
jgi:hypothetical protein